MLQQGGPHLESQTVVCGVTVSGGTHLSAAGLDTGILKGKR